MRVDDRWRSRWVAGSDQGVALRVRFDPVRTRAGVFPGPSGLTVELSVANDAVGRVVHSSEWVTEQGGMELPAGGQALVVWYRSAATDGAAVFQMRR